jgi:opacity protein-like surface antigen
MMTNKFMKYALLPLVMAGVENAEANNNKAYGGLSVGAQVGYSTGDSTLKQAILNPASPPNTVSTSYSKQTKDMSGRGVLGGINAGYGMIFGGNYYAGIEAVANWGSLQGKIGEGFGNHEVKMHTHLNMKAAYGGSLRIGGIVCDYLPYFKVGGLAGDWHSKTNLHLFSAKKSKNHHKMLGGLELGAGIEHSINDCWAWGMEYSHVQYGKLKYEVDFGVGRDHFEDYLKVKVTPRTNSFMFRLKYRVM